MNRQFAVNLAREEVQQYRLGRVRLRIVTTCCFAFGLMLLGTFGVYLRRHFVIDVRQKEMGIYAKRCEEQGLTPEKLLQMKADAEKLRVQIEALRSIVSSSASWSAGLAALADVFHREGVRIRSVETAMRGPRPVVRVEGSCPPQDAVTRVARVLRDIARKEPFGFGRAVALQKDAEAPQINCEMEIPIRQAAPPAPPPLKEGAKP